MHELQPRLMTVQNVLATGEKRFRIPLYQRNYDWGLPQIRQLIQDVHDYSGNDESYYLGNLIVYKRDSVDEVLDGQQRLTTLQLIALYLRFRLGSTAISDVECRPCLTFEARDISDRTIEELAGVAMEEHLPLTEESRTVAQWLRRLPGSEHSQAITHGLRQIEVAVREVFKEGVGREKLLERSEDSDSALRMFSRFLLSRVHLLRIEMPKQTDLTHYFEVMNNRGEQLHSHEVVKARLISALESERGAGAVVQKVWQACADRHRHVQMGFSASERGRVFGQEGQIFLPKSFDDLVEMLAVSNLRLCSETQTCSLDEAIKAGGSLFNDGEQSRGVITQSRENDEGVSERFTSIINFPNFLMQVLRLVQIKQQENKTAPDESFFCPLDDKYLLESFPKETIDGTWAKEFVFALLRTRFLFDTYVIKRESVAGKGHWSIKRFKLYDTNSDYVLTFPVSRDERSGESSHGMLQAAFHVSYPSFARKNWLSAVLYWLSDQLDTASVDSGAYLKFLEHLATELVFRRYLIEQPTPYIDFMYGINTEPLAKPVVRTIQKLPEYPAAPIFLFNYLDYFLWRDGHDGLDSSQLNLFQFSFKNSVEHFSAQQLRGSARLGEDALHRFGNLCLLTGAENTSLGNVSPEEKAKILLANRSKQAPLSLKLELMMANALKLNHGGASWDSEAIALHEKQMSLVLAATLRA